MNSLAAIKQRHKSGYHVFREVEEAALMHLDIHWLIDELEKAKPVLDAAKKLSSNRDNWCTSWFDLDRLDDEVRAMEE